ncbi:hypothetical protein H920_06872 [Fukomys damarensis]|uniref:Uncharacterized protein n=1 Tax=Fukomys damarensis TaxID=885580 RepID=A0A091DMJ6_FUKDA|nr:hypothetical protein H920_06872 [Fukomys damarensis]
MEDVTVPVANVKPDDVCGEKQKRQVSTVSARPVADGKDIIVEAQQDHEDGSGILGTEFASMTDGRTEGQGGNQNWQQHH